MKGILTVLLLIFTFTIYGQTAEEYLEKGIEKHEKQDFKGAIKEYSKAIKADKSNKLAYYNRGSCQLALKEYKSAMADFDKTIKLDPNFVKAYYSRATVFASQQKYLEALPDLDKTIALDPSTPNALTLRGQIRAQTGRQEEACLDFKRALELGESQAEQYLIQFCGGEVQSTETLLLEWPEEENWKVGSEQESGEITLVEYIHADESLEDWTEFGSMMTVKGAKNVPMDKAMNMMIEQAKKMAPKAKLTFIEKDESAEYPWIIFIIESPEYNIDNTPESQLWYVVQGKTSLFMNFRAIKEAKIPTELQEKWIQFFKTARVVDQ